MRQGAAVATSCLLVLWSALVASSQISKFDPTRITPIGSLVPDMSNAQIVSRNPDGSVTFDNGVTIYPDMSVVVQRGGRTLLRTSDGNITDITSPTSVITKKDPVTGVEHYYQVGPDNKAVEIKFPDAVARNSGERQRRHATDSPVASGSGFFISSDGYLLTNHHLVNGSRKIVVRTSNFEGSAKVVKIDPGNDLALLKIDGSFSAVPLGDARA